MTYNLAVIKSKNKVYISDNIKNEKYHRTNIKSLLFNGEYAKETYDKDWFEVNELPKNVEKLIPAKEVNKRYELLDGYPESKLTPKVVSVSNMYDSYESVIGLYEYKSDKQDATKESIDFKLNIIEEIDDLFEIVKTDFELEFDLLAKLTHHPVTLTRHPCGLSAQDSFNIIRNHVTENINNKYARITSDYDFCLTVKKIIATDGDKKEKVLTKHLQNNRTNYKTKLNKTREVVVFEVAPKSYQNYSVVKPFTGKNYDDLQNNITDYLNNLMKQINKPLEDCSHCNGYGVVESE